VAFDETTNIVTIEQRNHFKSGQRVEFFGPTITTSECIIEEIMDESGAILDAARHPKQLVRFAVPFHVNPFDMMRKV
jgi:putative protease